MLRLAAIAAVLLAASPAGAACRGVPAVPGGPAAPNGRAEPGEQCDTNDLRGLTCGNFCGQITPSGGSLSCNADCTLDTSGCAACGNDAIEGREVCDGTALGDAACPRGGPVTCLPSCGGWNFNACYRCGDHVRQGFEECDGPDLGGATCPAGSTSGSPTCRPDCRLDWRPCVRCGDGDKDPGEECDDGNTVAGDGCSPTCTNECGDGQIEPPDQCDDGGHASGDGCSSGCELERLYAGGGGEQADVCALQWGVATNSALGPVVHCKDGKSPCDRGPKGDATCRFLVYFCVNNPLFSGSCTWGGVARVELTGDSVSGPDSLTAADQTTVLDAFGTMLGRWGHASVTGSDPVRQATPPVQAEVCGQFFLDVAHGTTKAVAVTVDDPSSPANVDNDEISLVCD